MSSLSYCFACKLYAICEIFFSNQLAEFHFSHHLKWSWDSKWNFRVKSETPEFCKEFFEMPRQSFDNFFLHRNQWDCIHRSSVKLCILKGGHPQGLLSPQPLTAIFWGRINQLSITPQQTKLPCQLTLGFVCNPHTQFVPGSNSHPTLPLQVLLQAPGSDHPHATQWLLTLTIYTSDASVGWY